MTTMSSVAKLHLQVRLRTQCETEVSRQQPQVFRRREVKDLGADIYLENSNGVAKFE